MKDWFKARNIWGAAITALSDEEAGRLAKAIWAYTMTGEIQPIEGAGKGILAMILMTIGQDEERDSEISAKRAYVGSIGGRQKHANAAGTKQTVAIDSNCQQTVANEANATNKNKNKNIDKEQESESETLLAEDEAKAYQKEQDRLLDAAADAGFRMSNDVRSALIALYADHGLDRMMEGLRSCVEHDAPNLAYLKAVLKGKPKQRKPAVAAQDFGQRDYSDVQDQMNAELAAEMEAFKKEVV